MTFPRTCLLAVLLGCPAFGSAPSSFPSLYERIAVRLQARPDLAALGEPPPELAQVEWMLGSWTVEATVFATASSAERVDRGESVVTKIMGGCWLQTVDTYPRGTQDLGLFTFNRVTRRWLSLSVDRTGNAVRSSAAAWTGDRLVLDVPDAEILGETVALRQTVERRGPDEFVVLNAERMPSGEWLPLDQYRYRRRPVTPAP